MLNCIVNVHFCLSLFVPFMPQSASGLSVKYVALVVVLVVVELMKVVVVVVVMMMMMVVVVVMVVMVKISRDVPEPRFIYCCRCLTAKPSSNQEN